MNFKLLDHHIENRPLLLEDNISTQEFKKVFGKGRKKLRKFKINLIKEFVLRNPAKAAGLFLKEPRYYTSRIIRQVLKQ